MSGALLSPAAADPLADMLNRRDYDRDAILRQFPPNAPPPNADSDSDSPTESPRPPAVIKSEGNAPGFLPLQTRPAQIALQTLALILPSDGGGLAGRAAESFYRGCERGVRADGRIAAVDLYRTDGGLSATLRSYAAAADKGAEAVIGPLLKTNATALLKRWPHAPIPTLLLQTGGEAERGEGYFVMTLDAAREAADLARLLRRRGAQNAMIVRQNTPRGGRQQSAFEEAWLVEGGELPERFWVRTPADWRRLFDILKEPERETAAVFAAGDAKFAAKTRNFAPQRHAVFASSAVNQGARAAAALLVENLAFMEMPWFAGLDARRAELDSPEERTLPSAQQRFFALGADACRAALTLPQWRDGWSLSGLAGDWTLSGGVFEREGILTAYRGGRLLPVSP